ncbi:MAG: hypothetical protein WKG01_26735 [Kofleriaceae bacterium]
MADVPGNDDERAQKPTPAPLAPVSRPSPAWRRIPIDLVAFVGVAVAVLLSHRPFVLYGMPFNEPSWLFHLGHRVAVEGAAPYRDFVFHGGPLPIYVDAVFQGLFSSRYASSVYAGLFVTVLRVWVIWMIVRRLASWRSAIAIAMFCAVDPLFAFGPHWATPYLHLFITMSALFVVLSTRAEGRRALVHLVAAGAFAALSLAATPRATIAIAVLLLPATALLVRGKQLAPRSFAALWAGFAGGIAIVLAVLAARGLLGDALGQMFVAPASGGVLDAISGGALTSADYTWWGGVLYFLGVPALIIAGMLALAAREREISIQTIGLLLVPIAFILGLLMRYGQLDYFNDLPRLFFTLTTVMAVAMPERLRAWFGLEPLTALALGALPLACDWIAGMAMPGRSPGDPTALVIGVILMMLASSRLTAHAKLWTCVVVALAGLINFAVLVQTGAAPYAQNPLAERPRADSKFKANHRRMSGIAITEGRRDSIQWIKDSMEKQRSCFIYGNLPVLYTLLVCNNPTRLDAIGPGQATQAELDAAIAALRASPPDYLLAHESQFAPLVLDPATSLRLHPDANQQLHAAIRALAADYDSLGVVSSKIAPWFAVQAAKEWDQLDAVRLYRRKSLAPP